VPLGSRTVSSVTPNPVAVLVDTMPPRDPNDDDDIDDDEEQVRKETLAMLLSRAPAGVRLNEHLEHDDGPFVFHYACKLGLEGIVSKRKDLALQLRPLGVLDQIEESERTCGEERSRG
jgi:hypothetical protein